ncbi:class I SAM-dependent methyltransferase [Thermodesulfobacteriota bacterium]
MSIFYEQEGVPAHSVLPLPTREKAIAYPQGTICLGFCSQCGFIGNLALNPRLMDYTSEYNPTQAHSPTFNAFHRHLALHLIDKYKLKKKLIIEIGCGEGEFLKLLCELGENRGIGFDPACKEDSTSTITFVKDLYSEKYSHYIADFVCCKMTLEHIPDVTGFVETLSQMANDQTIVFLQIPDVMRILHDLAFWDIYYEHCSYFSSGSLARLLHRSGFGVLDLWNDYNDQYIMAGTKIRNKGLLPDDLKDLKHNVDYFKHNCQYHIDAWRKTLYEDKKTVVWGGGSKGVAFLNALKLSNHIDYVVDIDPLKQNTFLAGTGHRIVSPDFLQADCPDRIILMNPIYKNEIEKQIRNLGLNSEILTV